MRYTIESFVKQNESYFLTVRDHYFIISPNAKNVFYTVTCYVHTLGLTRLENNYSLKEALTHINAVISTYIECADNKEDLVYQTTPSLTYNLTIKNRND